VAGLVADLTELVAGWDSAVAITLAAGYRSVETEPGLGAALLARPAPCG
jgi:hypothetical protein